MQTDTPSGFFNALFDTSFSTLITTKIIKVLYILAMIVIGLLYIGFVLAGFADSATTGLLMLVVIGPIAGLIYLIMTRVYLEVVIVLFRLLETNTQIAAAVSGGAAPPAAAPSSSQAAPAAAPPASDMPPPPPIPPVGG